MKSNAVSKSAPRTRLLVFSALFIAISVVLKLIFEIYIPLGGFPSLRINLNSIPIIVSGLLLGPWAGFAVGVICDLLCFIVRPGGAWFIGFTLSSGLTGFIPGLLWKYTKDKKIHWLKWSNAVLAAGALLMLLSMRILSFDGSVLLYMGKPLSPLMFVLFVVLVLFFAAYPFIAGLFLKKAEALETENLLSIITVEQIVNSIVLNTLWLTILYGQAWRVLLPARIITNVFLIPIYTLLVAAVLKLLPGKYKNMN